MKYKRIENSNYNLHLIETDKFKTITVKVNFKREFLKEEITKRNLLVNILLEGSKNYPRRRLLEIKTEELYDIGYRIMNYASGKCSIMSFEMTFINPSYTEDIMYDESFKFINELIFNPYIDNNKFNSKNYKLACNISNDYFDTLKEDTNSYSQMRMLEEMDEEYISYRGCGYKEDLKDINEANLYECYKDIIDNDIVDIFVIGNISKDKAIDLVSKYLPFKTNKRKDLEHFYKRDKVLDTVKCANDKINKEQSTLVLGLRYDNLTNYDARYTLMVYNYILGGSTESNLFKTVREENSLCYYITSQSQPLLNIGLIRSGINADDYDRVVALIYQELENMKKGNFDDAKIENAKVIYINGLTELEDNQDSIISLYEGIEYLNSDTIDNRIKNINKVTRDDVIRVANMVHLNVIYLLEGILENEEK
jgi:predicted Zn-dependent peptidase